jgi:hypothetical protein
MMSVITEMLSAQIWVESFQVCESTVCGAVKYFMIIKVIIQVIIDLIKIRCADKQHLFKVAAATFHI